MPRSNRDLWREKLDRNVRRDEETNKELAERGWAVVRVWEHEDVGPAADRIEAIYSGRIESVERPANSA